MRLKALISILLIHFLTGQCFSQQLITFRVNAEQLIGAGIIHPESGDQVIIRGSFNSWSGSNFILIDSLGNGIYKKTISIPDNTNPEFKYVVLKSTGQVLWEHNPNPSNPPHGNRYFDPTSEDTDTFRLNPYHYALGGYTIRFFKTQLQQDFMQLRKILENNHCCLYEFTSKEQFDSLFDSQYNKIKDSLTPIEFFNLLTPITARIGCGHTAVWMPMEFWDVGQQHLFPLKLKYIEGNWLSDGSYYTSDLIPRGSEIIRINGKTLDSITTSMLQNYSADAMNPHFRLSQVERRFSLLYARSYGFYSGFDIAYTLPGESIEKKARLLPASNSAVRAFVFSNFTSPPLKFEIIDKNTALLSIPTFSYYDKVKYFTDFIDSCFTSIANDSIENLILDLRGNDGGDPFCAAPLFSYLQKKESPYFKEEYGKYASLAKPQPMPENPFRGELFVLIDGRCFSTNGHFTALLKYHNLGKFVGSETGATFWCNAGRNGIETLEYTRIQLYFARSKFEAAVDGLDIVQPISPDVHTDQSTEQFINNIDVTLQQALQLIIDY